jgi:hypothetical protein
MKFISPVVIAQFICAIGVLEWQRCFICAPQGVSCLVYVSISTLYIILNRCAVVLTTKVVTGFTWLKIL